ncbi:hypothetical protein C8R44DRAFT_342795 [Mycena epipterygia]|nr:hypothetical protein C8R44DRAFT_342795 [Mycena epipterygia]
MMPTTTYLALIYFCALAARCLPEPRPRTSRGTQDRAPQVFPLRRAGACAQRLHSAPEVLPLRAAGPHPQKLPHGPAPHHQGSRCYRCRLDSIIR